MAANLGTLTIDLIAKVSGFVAGMDKASRESKKWRDKVEKDVKTVGKAVGGLAVATAAGLTALTVNTVRAASEISKLAQLSGTSAEEFQFFAAGAKAVGIEQEKLGDIFKDVNDKVGDFLQTGGGPLADFFENIAPKVGVTADQFRKLSGPEALGLYVSSLEKAGASQQDMTFFLEAIASDATALLPLLKNNAEGFRILGEQAARAGAIMDDETIRAATELQAVSILTDQALTGLGNQIAAGMLPALSDLASSLFDVAGSTEVAREAGVLFGNVLKGIASIAFGAYAAVQLAGKGIATFGSAFFGSAESVGEGLQDLSDSAADYAKVLDGIWDSGGADTDFGKRVKVIADLLEESRKRNTANGIVIDQNAEENKKTSEAAEKAIRSQIEALQIQAAVLGLTTKQETLYKLAIEGANAAQLKQADIALSAVEAFEQLKKAKEEDAATTAYTDALRDQIALAQNAVDIEVESIGLGERRADQLRAINQIQQEYAKSVEDLARAQGTADALSEEAFQRRIAALKEAMDEEVKIVEEGERRKEEARRDALKGAKGAVEDYIDDANNLAAQTNALVMNTLGNFEDALVDFAKTGKLTFDDLANSIINDILRIGAKQLTANIAGGLLGAFGGGAGAGAGGGGFAGLFDHGGNIGSGQWGIVGENGPEIVQGPAAVTGRRETAAKLDRAISRVESGRTDSRMTASDVNVNMTVVTPDANSFRKSERQVSHSLRRGLNQ